MIKVNKGFLQINGNYLPLGKDEIDQVFCSSFEERISASPYDLFKKMTSNPVFDNPMASKLFKAAQEEIAGETAEAPEKKAEL